MMRAPSGSGGSGGPVAMGAAPCILLRGQVTAPTGMMRARSGSGGSGGPAAKGLSSLHSASRSGDRSYRTFVRTSSSSRRRGSILGFKKAGFSLIQMRWRHRTKVRIESRFRFWWERRPHREGFGLPAFCFAVRRPLLPGPWSPGPGFGGSGGPAAKGLESLHSASRPGGRSHQVGACSPWLLVFDKVDQPVG